MDGFAQHRTGLRALRLGISQLACLGRHTITGLLSAAGRQNQDWSADYRLFSQDRWQPEGLFAPVLSGLLGMVPPGSGRSASSSTAATISRSDLKPSDFTNDSRVERSKS
jgi:hypothetical protein